MNRQNKLMVYHGYSQLGEVDVEYCQEIRFPKDVIRIHRISPAGNAKCPPLAILQTIGSSAVKCKLVSSSPVIPTDLKELHRVCLTEFKTAIVLGKDEEFHLVAMASRDSTLPSFWVFSVSPGLYHSCLNMLMTRCLGIVFDLDETLVATFTLNSFGDKIRGLEALILNEIDEAKKVELSEELDGYRSDMNRLQQYIENDQIVHNEVIILPELEEITSDGQDRFYRPVIRLPDKNVILTRINPEIRDTSLLIKVRPDWEELRSTFTAVAAKRFEVYVCTKSQRDYALEVWRLLDPEAHLISLKEQKDRIVCVPPNVMKSLTTVFNGGSCHPKITMIVDDRLEVWEDKDSPRIHRIAPYLPHSPLELVNRPLIHTRQLAINFRAYFFRQFDESSVRSYRVCYEESVLPPSPSINYINALQ